ncbi:MAG TPA: hypothetical protein VHB79_08905 [Polyangiaceae bacterium]|nr:hypothetical protein [Polyangiaceae bacterium]
MVGWGAFTGVVGLSLLGACSSGDGDGTGGAGRGFTPTPVGVAGSHSTPDEPVAGGGNTPQAGDDAIYVWEPGALYGPPQGSDAFDGSSEHPVASLEHAVELAQKQGKSLVMACGGSLMSGFSVTGVTKDIRVVGGFACPDEDAPWQATKHRTTLELQTLAVTAPYSGHATVEVHDSSAHITLENFELAFTVEYDESPYGVQRIGAIFDHADVELKNVGITVEAGDSASTGFSVNNRYPSADKLNASQSEGAPGCSITCESGEKSSGGRGGLSNGGGAEPGLPAGPGGQPGAAALDGSYSCDDYGSHGGKGSDGESGANGVGAASVGFLQNGIFVGMPGTAGTSGKVGQGGGGGGAMLDLNGVPGACGGCPGAAGKGGGAGGSSIGILSIESKLVLSDSELETANGMPGAPGGDGQVGQMGGYSLYFEEDCAGGLGGKGGDGGKGGGGAGGLSVGVLYTGAAPVLMNTTIKVGLPGKGGLGMAMNDGIDGVAAATLELMPGQHCAGTASGCGALSAESSCGKAQGCSWKASCVASCFAAVDANACAELAGCLWEDETCKEFGTNCGAQLTDTACKAATSCQWGYCAGKTTTCEMLTTEACSSTPGCKLE